MPHDKRRILVTNLAGGGTVAPPAQPTGLTATPASTSQINLAWTDAATTETAYKVYRSTDGLTYAQVGTDLAAGSTSYNDTTSIAAGTKYYYKVAAVNAGGETLSDAATANTLTLSISAYWKLDETSGNRADSVGTSTLTDNNTVTYNPGKVSNAAQFTAANSEWLSVNDNAAISNTGDLTLAFWVYLDTDASVMGIVCKEPNNYTTGEYEIIYNNNVGGNKRFQYVVINTTGDATSVTASNFGTPSTGTWYFILATWTASSGTMTIQVNNGTANTGTRSGTARDGTVPLLIGAQTTTSRWFDGRIDEVGIWKRVLTTAERTALYNGGSGQSYPF